MEPSVAAASHVGMVSIPAIARFHFQVGEAVGSVFERINGQDGYPPSPGGGEQWPWEPHPRSVHDTVLPVAAFWIDKYPVTNAAYQMYLNASGYRPAERTNWLPFWDHRGDCPTPPAGGGRKPVTGVGLSEARAFCKHYSKRLPSEIEWSAAARGTDNRTYPWGNVLDGSRFPRPSNVTDRDPVPAAVDAHPSGASAAGVHDLVGNVWQCAPSRPAPPLALHPCRPRAGRRLAGTPASFGTSRATGWAPTTAR